MAAKKKKAKKKFYHSNLAGPYKAPKKKARKKSSKKKAKKNPCAPRHTTVKASDLLNRSKRKGRRWLCGGPVRSGCGGSNSQVIR